MARNREPNNPYVKQIADKITKLVDAAAAEASVPIRRVPEALRKLKKWAYIPSLVSVGPLHSNNKHLEKQGMQNIKKCYANALFTRVCKVDQTCNKTELIYQCTAAMKCSIDEAKKFYSEKVKLNEAMLVIDGCFVLEVLRRHRHVHQHEESSESKQNQQIKKLETENEPTCPVLDSAFMRHSLQHDLLIFENQLPYFVLQSLFKLTLSKLKETPNSGSSSLRDYVISYWPDIMELKPNNDQAIDIPSNINNESGGKTGDGTGSKQEVKHILHLLHKHYSDIYFKDQRPGQFKFNGTRLMPCASKLYCAGIKFVSCPRRHQFDIWFGDAGGRLSWCRRPQFRIPIRCTDRTEPLLRNLIAFEQCYQDVEPCFTSYALLMNALIDTAVDVDVLVDAKVMQNSFETSEEAARLYNELIKEVAPDMNRFYFVEIYKKADEYSKRKWAKVRALPASLFLYLCRSSLTTPWTVIGFFLAFITVGVNVAVLL